MLRVLIRFDLTPVFLDNAKQQAGQIIHEVQDALKDDGRKLMVYEVDEDQ